MATLTTSEAEDFKEMGETVETTEALAARAEITSPAPQHHRQRLHPPMARSPSKQDCADGTVGLATRLSNASPIAPVILPSWPHKTRETAREDADSERGHPLLFIIIKK